LERHCRDAWGTMRCEAWFSDTVPSIELLALSRVKWLTKSHQQCVVSLLIPNLPSNECLFQWWRLKCRHSQPVVALQLKHTATFFSKCTDCEVMQWYQTLYCASKYRQNPRRALIALLFCYGRDGYLLTLKRLYKEREGSVYKEKLESLNTGPTLLLAPSSMRNSWVNKLQQNLVPALASCPLRDCCT
jgi:hypothetical protein